MVISRRTRIFVGILLIYAAGIGFVLYRVLADLFEWLGFHYLRLRSAQANANANARDSEVEPGHLAA